MRTRRLICLLSAACLASTVAAPAASAVARATDATAATSARVEPSARAGELWAKVTSHRMSLEEKVGQLFSTHVYGQTVDSSDPLNITEYGLATPREIIEKYHLGGVLYFNWTHSVDNPTQTANLSNGIQKVALRSGAHVPMLMSIDQEGGLVTRMLEPATQTAGAMAIGATGSPDSARTLAAIQGKELAAVGVRQNFAPVADVNINPANPVIGVRSFSSDPTLTATLTAAQVQGYQKDAKISSAAKHFPGHGDTDVDSHYGFPIINHTRAEWEQIDKPPFQAAIKAGIDVIMTAHIQVPALDPSGDPATLSKPILTGILRGEMGYQGVIVTDALGMQGVRDKYGDARVPVLALNAGVDILLNPPNLEVAYNAVVAAVKSGEIPMSRIDDAVLRILKLKWNNGTVLHPFVDVRKVSKIVGSAKHLQQVQEITDTSTTALRNEGSVLPIAAQGRKIVVTGYGDPAKPQFAAALAKYGATATVSPASTNPTAAETAAAVSATQSADAAVVLTYNAAANAGQVTLVEALEATGKPVVVVAVRNPYDIALFPAVSSYLATYSTKPVALESAARVITGKVSPTGKLPVDIPAADGSILYPFGSGLTW